jgi:hypothetical protein
VYRTAEYVSGSNPLSRMYFEAVKFRAQRQTVTSSIASATELRRTV